MKKYLFIFLVIAVIVFFIVLFKKSSSPQVPASEQTIQKEKIIPNPTKLPQTGDFYNQKG